MRWVAAALFLSTCTIASAADVRPNGPYTPNGYCQITSLTTAVTLVSGCSGGVPQSTTIAEICTETVAVRYRDDGTSPTSSVGMPVAASTCFQYAGDMTAIKFIQQASSGIIDVSFYK